MSMEIGLTDFAKKQRDINHSGLRITRRFRKIKRQRAGSASEFQIFSGEENKSGTFLRGERLRGQEQKKRSARP
jgi:hypothetical protein